VKGSLFLPKAYVIADDESAPMPAIGDGMRSYSDEAMAAGDTGIVNYVAELSR
jgi:hypothetical protein